MDTWTQNNTGSVYFYGRGISPVPDGNSNYLLNCTQCQGGPNTLYWCLISGTPPCLGEVEINPQSQIGLLST